MLDLDETLVHFVAKEKKFKLRPGCIQFLRDIASVTGLSYEEINVWLFIILQPSLILLFFVLWRIEKKKR